MKITCWAIQIDIPQGVGCDLLILKTIGSKIIWFQIYNRLIKVRGSVWMCADIPFANIYFEIISRVHVGNTEL